MLAVFPVLVQSAVVRMWVWVGVVAHYSERRVVAEVVAEVVVDVLVEVLVEVVAEVEEYRGV